MPTIRHGRTAAWAGLPIICAALVIASVQTIPVAGPTVRIRWDDDVEVARRTVFERRMRLVNGEADPDGYWTYLLLDTSPTNIALIVNTTVVDATHFIDRDRLTMQRPEVVRPLAVSHVAENRIVLPILSAQGILDIGATMLMVGVPVLLLGLRKSESGRERRLIWLFALPSLIFLVAWWPAQGVSMESDLLFAIFPAFFAGAWSCSRTPAATVAGLSLVLVCHAVFWWVILAPDFETVFVSIASRGLLLLT